MSRGSSEHVGSRPWLPRPLVRQGLHLIEINDEYMILTIGDMVIATAWFSQHAAGDGNGAWIVSSCPARLFTRDQAITALTVVEFLGTGYPDDAPIVVALREELR